MSMKRLIATVAASTLVVLAATNLQGAGALTVPTGDIADLSFTPVGSPPLSDSAAAALVTPAAENRPQNGGNYYQPTETELATFRNAVYRGGPNAGMRADEYNPLLVNVTGDFSGTTDEILQWAAYKWGIPPDLLRAVAVNESNWNQGEMGDPADVTIAHKYPKRARVDGDTVYESMGITQIKWRADGSLNPGTEALRRKSTAFNADLWGANVRYYYDGYCSWCRPGYTPGQLWESIGAHYDPSPWGNQGALDYIDRVKGILAARTWEQPDF
jgi:hypothetical protein